MFKPTPRQKHQYNVRQALGTVMGFNGYLNNLETVLQRTNLYNRGQHHLINALRDKLVQYRRDLEAELKAMKDRTDDRHI